VLQALSLPTLRYIAKVTFNHCSGLLISCAWAGVKPCIARLHRTVWPGARAAAHGLPH
jgi:hypothetical protein